MKKRIILLLLIVFFSLFIPGFVSADMNIDIVSTYGKNDAGNTINGAAYQDSTVYAYVKVKNLDESSTVTKKVECGVYEKALVEDWYGTTFSLIPTWYGNVPNCNPAESFVQTKDLSWDEGETHYITFSFDAPSDMTTEYIVHCSDYLCCYNVCPGETGQTSYDTQALSLLDDPGVSDEQSPSCDDNAVNGEETDINCGGSECPACPDYYECKFDRDCQSGSVCVDNTMGETICVPEDDALASDDYGEPLPGDTDDESVTDEDLDDAGVLPSDDEEQEISRSETVVAKQDEDGSGWAYVPIILNPDRVFDNQEIVEVKGVFYAAETGFYWLEAGMGRISPLYSTIKISQNTCDPNEIRFANKKVYLEKGNHDIIFEIGAVDDGMYNFWVAHVTGCGGSVLHQVKGRGLLSVGTPDDGVRDNKNANVAFGIGLSTFIFLGIGLFFIVLAIFLLKGKKGQGSSGFAVGVFMTIILLLLVTIILVFTGVIVIGESGASIITKGGASDDVTSEDGEPIVIQQYIENDDDVNLCELYTENFESYINNRSINCEAAGGNWLCEDDRIGCYDIPTWNYLVACISNEVKLMKLVCETAGADYDCGAHTVNCENDV